MYNSPLPYGVIIMPPKKWGSVSLPEELISDVDDYLKTQKILFTSRNEFVRRAVIDLLYKVGFYKQEEAKEPMRQEIHIDEDGTVTHSIGKDDQPRKVDLEKCTDKMAVEG